MQEQFNLLNYNELIYLYKEGNKKPILFILNNFKNKIKSILINILNKFYNLPLEVNDFNSYIYLWTINAVKNYKLKYQKKFSNYLILNIKWNIINLINKFLSKKHLPLNNSKYNLSSFKLINNQKVDYNRFFLYYILNKVNLSKLEKEILNYKLQGKTNINIVKITTYSYKTIDNAFCRVKNKLRLLNGDDFY